MLEICMSGSKRGSGVTAAPHSTVLRVEGQSPDLNVREVDSIALQPSFRPAREGRQ
jgi:hypothetical protein